MKKALLLVLAFVLVFSLAACGGNDNGGNSTNPPASNTPSGNTNTPTPPQTQNPAPSTPDSTPDTTPAAAQLREFAIDPSAISLKVTENADGTLSYTYRDTSVKPAYVAHDDEGNGLRYLMVWGIEGYREATEVLMNIITPSIFSSTNETVSDNAVFDVSANIKSGLDNTSAIGNSMHSNPMTDFQMEIDDKGLTATWTGEVTDAMNNSGEIIPTTASDLVRFHIHVRYAVTRDSYGDVLLDEQEIIFSMEDVR